MPSDFNNKWRLGGAFKPSGLNNNVRFDGTRNPDNNDLHNEAGSFRGTMTNAPSRAQKLLAPRVQASPSQDSIDLHNEAVDCDKENAQSRVQKLQAPKDPFQGFNVRNNAGSFVVLRSFHGEPASRQRLGLSNNFRTTYATTTYATTKQRAKNDKLRPKLGLSNPQNNLAPFVT